MGATYFYITKTKFDGSVGGIPASAETDAEDAILPFMHIVSPKLGNWRFGVSVVEPAGISKRWDSPIQKITAEESDLDVIEINPSAAYAINSRFSIGAGIRILYADATFKAQLPPGMDPVLTEGYRQDVDGDAWSAGFNLALTYKPTDSLRLAATFRSEIDMDIEGTGSGYTTNPLNGLRYPFNDASIDTSLPMPAMLALAVSQTFGKTMLEFVYERVFWSAYDVVDPSFDDPIIEMTLGQPRRQDWKDTNDFRLGISYQYNNALKLMGGVSYEETPVPAETLGFDLPDSDILWFSAGAVYAFKPNIELGLAYTYGHYRDRTVRLNDDNINGIVGKFSNTAFHSATASFTYSF